MKVTKKVKIKKVKASELSTIKMVAGNEKRYTKVIDDGVLKEWVGFGWVDLGEPTVQDFRRYLVVIR